MEKRVHAGGSAESGSAVRFGPFELELRTGELRKEGRRIRLQEQPLQILRMLLESPGEVVSREEIRKRLWPDETVVEFDLSINAAIRRLRGALRDSAENPRYIKTLSRRGYCFIGETETSDPPAQADAVVVTPDAGQPGPPVQAPPRRPGLPLGRPVFVAALLATVVLIALAVVWFYKHGARPVVASLQPLMSLDFDLGSEPSPAPGSDRGARAILSPDGTRLVYESHSKLFTRRLDQANATDTELPGTEGAKGPFFSPEGKWVAFFSPEGLKKVSLQDGRVGLICRCGSPSTSFGGSWGEDGNIVASVGLLGLSRIPSGGGTPARLTDIASGEIVHRWPQILPGGKTVLFSVYTSVSGLDGATIQVVSLRDGRRKTLVPHGTWGRYLPTGHLVYIDRGTLFAVPFDLDRLEVRGTPTLVLENVAYNAAWGSAQIDFSRTGSLVYRSSLGGGGMVTVQWLDESGHTQPLLAVPGNYLSPTLSPDGGRLALTSAGDIWVYELGGGGRQLTFGGGYGNPLWTPDGRYIVFRGSKGMWWTRADGISQPQPLFPSENHPIPWSFAADDKRLRLAFDDIGADTGGDLWTVPVDSDASGLRAGKPEVFLQTRFNERAPGFSPDGRWIAYYSDESGDDQVYVRAFPDGHGNRVSTTPGVYPSWSRNGHELFFRTYGAHNQLMVASIQERGDSLVVETPRVWFGKRIPGFSFTKSYDPAPDGKRIVALLPADTLEEPHDRVIFLLNFFDELRRRAPLSED